MTGFDKTLLNAPITLKDFINNYAKQKEIFALQERHESTILKTYKKFFSNEYIVDIFVFVSAIILLLTISLTVYILCKHKKIRVLIACLVLHHGKDLGTTSDTSGEMNSECTTLAYMGIILTILSLIIVTFLHYRKSKFCKGHTFLNVVKIMIFISDVYVPIKICKAAVSIHLFKITGMLKSKDIKLNKNYLWDTLEIYWKGVTVTFNCDKINLPIIVIIKLQDKIKVTQLMNKEPLFFHLMLKKGITWFTLTTETHQTL